MIDRKRIVLSQAEWEGRMKAHEARVSRWTDPHQERAARGEKHPVYDFLFDYYSFRPSLLKRWHPGIGAILTGEGADSFLTCKGYVKTPQGVGLDMARLPQKRRETVEWIRTFLRRSGERPPAFGCFGLHEWAMVYKTPQVRHDVVPLRFPPEEIAEILDMQVVRCSHFDAFRFFTPQARPLNRLQPERETRMEMEQPGCLHANMDLYKWASKLSPWTSSELIADTFSLAREIREVDMRASPYDLEAIGFPPIKIETPTGRAEYEHHQRIFSRRAAALRHRLITECDEIMGTTDTPML